MIVHLASEEQFDPYSFVKYIRIIGRAYQRQAIELVMIAVSSWKYLGKRINMMRHSKSDRRRPYPVLPLIITTQSNLGCINFPASCN